MARCRRPGAVLVSIAVRRRLPLCARFSDIGVTSEVIDVLRPEPKGRRFIPRSCPPSRPLALGLLRYCRLPALLAIT
jgi:hypothetical protein